MLSNSTEKKKQLVPGEYKRKENPEPVESRRAVHWCGIKNLVLCRNAACKPGLGKASGTNQWVPLSEQLRKEKRCSGPVESRRAVHWCRIKEPGLVETQIRRKPAQRSRLEPTLRVGSSCVSWGQPTV